MPPRTPGRGADRPPCGEALREPRADELDELVASGIDAEWSATSTSCTSARTRWWRVGIRVPIREIW